MIAGNAGERQWDGKSEYGLAAGTRMSVPECLRHHVTYTYLKITQRLWPELPKSI